MKSIFVFIAFLMFNFWGCTVKKSNHQKELSSHSKQTVLGSEKKEVLTSIRTNFKRINSISHWDQVKELELFESTEGGNASYYFSKGKLEKIVAHYYGETFQEIDEYYLLKGELSFVFEKSYDYNRPIYWDTTKMKSFNDTEVFDFEKSNIHEQRNYFQNGKLFDQLESGTGGTSLSQEYLIKEENRIKSAFRSLLKKAENL